MGQPNSQSVHHPPPPLTTNAPEVPRLDVVHPGQPRRRGAVGALGEEALELGLRLRGAAAVLQNVVQLVAVEGCVYMGEESRGREQVD
jgi:hypothetical protein